MIIRFCLMLILVMSGCKNAPIDAAQGLYAISGKCYQKGSIDPIGGVVVHCGNLTASSGQDGAFVIKNVPAGSQTLTAEKEGLIAHSESIDVAADLTINVFLDFYRTDVSGYVSNPVDGPILGARVTLGTLIDVTDISGRFEFHNVPRIPDTLVVTEPTYNPSTTVLIPNGDSLSLEIVLSRDSVIIGSTPGTVYVDQARPTRSFPQYPYTEHLYLQTNGLDSLGVIVNGVERIIYAFFQFPQILSDPRVSLVETSLEMCTDSAYAPFDVQVYDAHLNSSTFALSYNNQPKIGKLLWRGTIGDNASARYWTILGTEGMNELLSEYRSNGSTSQIAIKGGTIYPVGFYSSQGQQNRPRITYKIHY